jgi:hypothetical protein
MHTLVLPEDHNTRQISVPFDIRVKLFGLMPIPRFRWTAIYEAETSCGEYQARAKVLNMDHKVLYDQTSHGLIHEGTVLPLESVVVRNYDESLKDDWKADDKGFLKFVYAENGFIIERHEIYNRLRECALDYSRFVHSDLPPLDAASAACQMLLDLAKGQAPAERKVICGLAKVRDVKATLEENSLHLSITNLPFEKVVVNYNQDELPHFLHVPSVYYGLATIEVRRKTT